MNSKDSPIAQLCQLMAHLRSEQGCSWDKKQTYQSLKQYTLEEAHEVIEAVEHNDLIALKDELGDLLLQIVFYCQLANEQAEFDFNDVTQAIIDKMIRRHPHVFANKTYANADEQKADWEAIKVTEQSHKWQQYAAKKTVMPKRTGQLAGIPNTLPALSYALKLQQKAAQVGFDWDDIAPVFSKIEEEIQELKQEIQDNNLTHAAAELGDVLFALVNLGRHLQLDAEIALRQTNHKFKQRFAYIEQALLRQNKTPEQATLTEMDALWEQAKQHE